MKAEIGSISFGTMRSQDLVQCFLSELEILANGSTDLTIAITSRIEFSDQEDNCYDYYESDDVDYDVHELFDALDEYAPDGCYFGANPGDGADYGFWQSEQETS